MTKTAPDQNIRIASLGGTAVVTACGEIGYANAAQLQEALVSAAGAQVLVVADMSGTDFCDSSGVAALITGLKHARAAGGDLRLVIGADAIRRIFKLTGADRILKCYDSLPAALAAALAGDPPLRP